MQSHPRSLSFFIVPLPIIEPTPFAIHFNPTLSLSLSIGKINQINRLTNPSYNLSNKYLFHSREETSLAKNLPPPLAFSTSFRDENGRTERGKHEWLRERERERGGSVWKGRWQEDKGIPRATTALERVWTITDMFERRAALMPKAYSRRSWWSGSSASSNGPSLSQHLNRMSTQASPGLRVTNLWGEEGWILRVRRLSSLSINYWSWSSRMDACNGVCLDFSFGQHFFLVFFFFFFLDFASCLEVWFFFFLRWRKVRSDLEDLEMDE